MHIGIILYGGNDIELMMVHLLVMYLDQLIVYCWVIQMATYLDAMIDKYWHYCLVFYQV